MAVDIFLKVEGLNGESKDDKHKDEIDIMSFSWGATNQGSTQIGGGGGSGKVSVQDLTVTKWGDLATPSLMLACITGKHFDKATLTLRKAAGDNPLEHLVITMGEVLITGVSIADSASGDSRVQENVSLNFAKVKYEYTEQSDTGGDSKKGKWGLDIAGNKPWS
jgi:type VI secretion system secreted protein Hcp